ncbi:hypothetical protein F2P81_020430 [Scophthalmus maximus]|uniref:Uncharacterized protein n=1 Tax=Scophthalmus maximus TaxID=52904 RepID=A0A6A4S571_SCOMX|nr:hypothetical protein F2P81_020430 [Scophthalmus maximus]
MRTTGPDKTRIYSGKSPEELLPETGKALNEQRPLPALRWSAKSDPITHSVNCIVEDADLFREHYGYM